MSLVEHAEISTPAELRIDDGTTLTTLIRDRATTEPSHVFAEYKDTEGRWLPVTLDDFYADVRALAKGLIAMNVEPGNAVGLMASTRYEWTAVDFAIQACGGVTVPIYPTSSESQVEWIHEDSRLAAVIVENAEQMDLVRSIPDAPIVLAFDDQIAPAVATLRDKGGVVSDDELAARTAGARADDVATVVYTSGTTGRPKGVSLTHRNFIEHAQNAAAHQDFSRLADPGSKVLLFLPLAHVFGRFVSVLALTCGAVLGFAPSTKTIATDMREFKPTWMLAVPRVLETVYNKADTGTGGGLKQRIFRWAAAQARDLSVTRAAGAAVGPMRRLRHRIADTLVLHKIREAMGGSMRYIVCGGARLSERLGHFFAGAGVTVMEGYGSTELSAPVTCNPPSSARVGTVGIPFPGCTVRIAEDGEILAQGPNVFAGYLHRDDATAEVVKDGWFATGDLGRIDDGHLVVIGRKKEILITASGKNVQPTALEDLLRPHPLVQEAVVVGDGQPFIAALVALDETMLPAWLASNGLPSMTAAEAAVHDVVRAHLQTLIDKVNATVSRAESIRTWRILPRELSEHYEEISASMKVRRDQVISHFGDTLEDIYGAPSTS